MKTILEICREVADLAATKRPSNLFDESSQQESIFLSVAKSALDSLLRYGDWQELTKEGCLRTVEGRTQYPISEFLPDFYCLLNNTIFIKNHSQWPRPIFLCQLSGFFRNLCHDFIQSGNLCNMNDQRIVGRSALRFVNFSDDFASHCVARKAVNGFRRNGHESAVFQRFGGDVNVRRAQNFSFHFFNITLLISRNSVFNLAFRRLRDTRCMLRRFRYSRLRRLRRSLSE